MPEIKIIRSNRKTLSIQVKPDEIIARAPLFMKEKEIYAFIDAKKSWIERSLIKLNEHQKISEEAKPFTEEEIKALSQKAKKIIPEKVKFYAEKVGVTYNRITIRCQRTRWGSCSSQKNLNFNCLLVLFPDEIIDSIVVHELCHLTHMNHSSAFYKEIDKVFPDYKKCHLWLNENGKQYLYRLPK